MNIYQFFAQNRNAAKRTKSTAKIHGQIEKKAIRNSSIYSNFNYCPALYVVNQQ